MEMCASHYSGQWNRKNKDRYNENWRVHYGRNSVGRRRRSKAQDLKKLYGMTLDDYDIMLEDQAGVCAICGREERAKSAIDDATKDLAVDHNHTTGKIRGLLCSSCNRGLGYFGDDINRLNAAINYMVAQEEEVGR
jgi:hypothetical protein